MFGDLFAGKEVLRVLIEKAADPGQSAEIHALVQGRTGRQCLPVMDQLVNGALVHAAGPLLQQPPGLKEPVQRLTEAGELERLDKIIQHPPGEQALDDMGVVGGGDRDDEGALPRVWSWSTNSVPFMPGV